jgi:hypothetical protein
VRRRPRRVAHHYPLVIAPASAPVHRPKIRARVSPRPDRGRSRLPMQQTVGGHRGDGQRKEDRDLRHGSQLGRGNRARVGRAPAGAPRRRAYRRQAVADAELTRLRLQPHQHVHTGWESGKPASFRRARQTRHHTSGRRATPDTTKTMQRAARSKQKPNRNHAPRAAATDVQTRSSWATAWRRYRSSRRSHCLCRCGRRRPGAKPGRQRSSHLLTESRRT